VKLKVAFKTHGHQTFKFVAFEFHGDIHLGTQDCKFKCGNKHSISVNLDVDLISNRTYFVNFIWVKFSLKTTDLAPVWFRFNIQSRVPVLFSTQFLELDIEGSIPLHSHVHPTARTNKYLVCCVYQT
jgi:hypothetical protein